MEAESSHYSSSYSVRTTDFETGEDVEFYLSDQYQTMDSWDDSEDDSRTIYYDLMMTKTLWRVIIQTGRAYYGDYNCKVR